MHHSTRASMISRRHFLKGAAGVAAGSALLAACAPGVPGSPATQSEGAAPAAGGNTDVYVTTFAAFADMGQREATELFNEEANARGVNYILEDNAEGWETKGLAMIREKNVRWSACGIANAGLQWNYIQQGLVQPIDELLQTSTLSWAQNLDDEYLYPNIKEATIFDGKTYYLPMKLNIHLMGYRQDYLEQAGYDAIPETWDEFEVLLDRLMSTLGDQNVVPFAIRKEVFRTLGTTFTTFVDNPYDDKNMLRIDSDEWLQVIKMYKRWFDAGFTNLQLMQDPLPDWQKGAVAIGIDSHSWIRLGRSTLGAEKVMGTVPPRANAGDPKRTWVHLDSGFVLAEAPHPQEGLDWLLAVLGPEGAPADRYWSGTLTFSGMPVHKQQYEKLIANNPDLPELIEAYEAVPNSVLQPMEAGRYYPIIQAKIWPWLERYWGGEIEAETAMENTIKEVEEELAKQGA